MDKDLEVTSVSWRGHLKRLHFAKEKVSFDVPLSACVSTSDKVRVSNLTARVVCQNGEVTIFPLYVKRDSLRIGGLKIDVLIKEITDEDEYHAYQTLANFHYRGKRLFGRTAKLVIRTFHPLLPRVIGYIELTSPFFMNKARSRFLNAPFSQNGISWEKWDMEAKRKYIHLFVRIARCVVYAEFRGLGLGQVLVNHAAAFAQDRWQLAGYKPYFMEISADMLKFVPFAERAGMTYIGETQGNLDRVYKDISYLMSNARRIQNGEIVPEDSSGIVDQQVARMHKAFALVEAEGMSAEELLERLENLSEGGALEDFALFHDIVSLPKPTYIQGLTRAAVEFTQQRASSLVHINTNHKKPLRLESINSPIRFNEFSATFYSRVERTKNTHTIQQAFGISPDHIDTGVIRDLTVDIDPGQIVLVFGPSGSGKTTLLHFLLSSAPNNLSHEGELTFPSNYDPAFMKEVHSEKALVEVLTHEGQDASYALQLMGLVGLSDAYVYLKRFDELSKGQQFRAMLAKVIAEGSNVWVLDEFCSNLDTVTANVVADKLQRTARDLGATVIVAAPHCHYFVHSLKPDLVIQLTTAWEHKILSGRELLSSIRKPKLGGSQAQSVRLKSEYFQTVLRGRKTATIRKGKQKYKKGLLVLECGKKKHIVYATSVRYCHLDNVTLKEAIADGFCSKNELISALQAIYPGLKKNHYVTVVSFESITLGLEI